MAKTFESNFVFKISSSGAEQNRTENWQIFVTQKNIEPHKKIFGI